MLNVQIDWLLVNRGVMGQPPWQPRCGAWPALLFAALVLYGGVAGAVDVSVPCNGGYRGVESGTLVAVMPPDVPSPTGGLASPGVGTNGLILGDTHGRTPGSYGFFIACDVQGYLGPTDVVSSATIVLTQGGSIGIDPLGPGWNSSAGLGPAKLLVEMVSGRWRVQGTRPVSCAVAGWRFPFNGHCVRWSPLLRCCVQSPCSAHHACCKHRTLRRHVPCATPVLYPPSPANAWR